MRALAILLQLGGALVWGLAALVATEMSRWLGALLGLVCVLLLVGVGAYAMGRRWGRWLLVGLGFALSTVVVVGSLLLAQSDGGLPVWAAGFYLSVSVVPLAAVWSASPSGREPLAR